MEQFNIHIKKISYPKKWILVIVFLILIFLISMIPIIQFLLQKKFYKSTVKIKINFENFFIERIILENPLNNFFYVINDKIFNDDFLIKIIDIDRYESTVKKKEALLNFKERIFFNKDNNENLSYSIILVSVESEKKGAIELLNKMTRNIKLFLENNLLQIIENNQENVKKELLSELHNKIKNKTDLDFIKQQLLNENNYKKILIKTYPPIINIEPAVEHIAYYSPNKNHLYAYLILALYINGGCISIVIFVLIMTSSLCETRKEYKLRKKN